MTAITHPVRREADAPARHHTWQHIVRVTRLQFVDPWVLIWTPAVIIGAAWLVSIVIALIITRVAGLDPEQMRQGMSYSWAVLSPFWYFAAVGVQAVGTTLQFALGIGSTRRDYWLGTTLAFAVFSAAVAVVFAGLRAVEVVTGGWGTSAVVFDALWYGDLPWWLAAYTTFTLSLAVLVIGAALTTCYLRWRVIGVVTVGLAVVAALLIALAAITWLQAWPALIGWFAGIGVTGVFGIVLGIALLAGIGGYLVIRRATPR